MSGTYYLFQMDEDDAIVAVEKVIGLDQIKERMTKLTALKPTHYYLVYDRITAKFVEPFKKSA